KAPGQRTAATGPSSLTRATLAALRRLHRILEPPSRLGSATASRVRAAGRRALALSIAAPGRVLLVAALLAIAGWGVGTRIPEISLPDFLYGGRQGAPSEGRIKADLRLLPKYVAQAVVTTDPATGKPGNTGVITFGIRVMPFDQQKQLIDDIRSQVNPPGTGN